MQWYISPDSVTVLSDGIFGTEKKKKKVSRKYFRLNLNLKWQLKDFSSQGLCFIHVYVWGPWLRKMTFYLLFSAALQNVIICMDSEEFWEAIIERCGDALWSEVHTALIILCSFTNKHEMPLDLLCFVYPSFTVISLHTCFFVSFIQVTCWTCWSGEPTPKGSTTASLSWRRSMARRLSK